MNAEMLLAHYDRIADAPDAIARMRRFVLDLAVRGKLVEQDPTDEPASELLTRIATEKAKLENSGKIRKEGRPAQLNSLRAPFDAPSGWRWACVRQVTSDRGQTTPVTDFTYIDVTAINKEVGIIASAKVLSASEAPSRARKIVRRGDVLYSCVRPTLLNVAVVDTDFVPPPIVSTAFAVLNGFALVLARYIWIVVRSPFFVELVEGKMRGQAYPAINESEFASLPFPLAPLAEQHRIVAKFDELVALCDSLEAARAEREAARDQLAAASLGRLNAPDPETFSADARFALSAFPALTTRPNQIRRLRQTILNVAVRGKLVPQDPRDEKSEALVQRICKRAAQPSLKTTAHSQAFRAPKEDELPYPTPRGWSWLSAEQLVVPGQILTYGILKPVWVADGVPTVRVSEMKYGSIDVSELPRCDVIRAAKFEKTKLEEGDLLISKDGTIGRTAFVPAELAGGNITQHVLRFPISPEMSRRFVKLAIDGPPYQARMAGETKGVALQGVNVGDFRKMLLPIPPLAEQLRIVAKVDELMVLCDQLEASLTFGESARLRLLDAILHETLNSELSVAV